MTKVMKEKKKFLNWNYISQSEWQSSRRKNNKFWQGCGEKGALICYK
jgi:hypothetical protein